MSSPPAVPVKWRPGMVIGAKFALTRRLEVRSHTTVFEARHVALGRPLAIEILDGTLGADADVVGNLQRAMAAASAVEHPNIVAAFDVAKDAPTGARFVARRLLRGPRLSAKMAEGPMGIADALDLLVPIMGALEAVHRLHVLHGGVRPESVVLARKDTGDVVPTLVDFGLAQADLRMGGEAALRSMRYVAPEQARGEPIDARADVFAVGAILFEMLAGRTVWDAPTLDELRALVADGAPLRLDDFVSVATGTRDLVTRALERDRTRRFSSVAEMLRAALVCSVDGSGLGGVLAARHRASLGDLMDKAHTIWSAPRSTPVELAAVPTSLRGGDAPRMRAMVDAPPTHEHAPHACKGSTVERDVREAHALLQASALEEAVARAGEGLERARDDAARGELTLVQAIARAWQGRFQEAATLADKALDAHALFSARWLAAHGVAVEAAGALGAHEKLASLSAALIAVPPEAKRDDAYAIAACRLAIQLLHVGQVTAAERWLADARAVMQSKESVLAEAFLEAARVQTSIHEGDLDDALAHATAAAECFEEVGAARDACRMRASAGHALVELGAFPEAATVLEETLACAEPMGLHFVPSLHAELGRARLRLDPDAALASLRRAALDAMMQGDHWSEAFARAWLARGLVERDRGSAQREARSAIEASTSPSSRALALAVLAELAVADRHPAEALGFATEAYQLLAKLRGVESGQVYIRLQFAAALEATGRGIEARAVLEAARDRLVALANRLDDDARRARFFEVPENAAVRAGIRRSSGSQPPPS